MHEVKLTIGKAKTTSPRNIEWKQVLVSNKNNEFMRYYNMLTKSISRNLYFLLQKYDARYSWIDNNIGRNITGMLISADYSFSYESTATRNFSFVFYADGSEDIYIAPNSICKFYIGIETEQNQGEIIYIGLGAGVIDSPNWKFDSSSRQISFNAIDVSCLIDGQRSGYLSFQNFWKYNQDTSVKRNIMNMIDFEVTKNEGYAIEYTDESISECIDTNGEEFLVQNDIESTAGTTTLEMLNKIINNSLPYYCFYFDSNGLLNYSIQPVADINRYTQYELPQSMVVSESNGINYNNRYNYIEVWGLSQDPTNMNIDIIRGDGYKGALIFDGNTYDYPGEPNVHIQTGMTYNETLGTTDLKCFCERLPLDPDSFEYTGDESWGCCTIILNDCTQKIRINVNNMHRKKDPESPSEPVWYELNGEYYIGDMNIIYLNRTPEETQGASPTHDDYNFYFTGAGRMQPYGIAEQRNGAYGIDTVGRMRYVLEDSTISTDAKCVSRAKWELYKSMQVDKILQVSMVPQYYIQAGHLVQYTSIRTGETDTYIVKSVSCSLQTNGYMNVQLEKFYKYYEEV